MKKTILVLTAYIWATALPNYWYWIWKFNLDPKTWIWVVRHFVPFQGYMATSLPAFVAAWVLTIASIYIITDAVASRIYAAPLRGSSPT
jgi:hypothetical protein